jgi:hypothetical protein
MGFLPYGYFTSPSGKWASQDISFQVPIRRPWSVIGDGFGMTNVHIDSINSLKQKTCQDVSGRFHVCFQGVESTIQSTLVFGVWKNDPGVCLSIKSLTSNNEKAHRSTNGISSLT